MSGTTIPHSDKMEDIRGLIHIVMKEGKLSLTLKFTLSLLSVSRLVWGEEQNISLWSIWSFSYSDVKCWTIVKQKIQRIMQRAAVKVVPSTLMVWCVWVVVLMGGGVQLYVVNTWSHCIRVLLKKSWVSVFYCWCILFIIGCIWQSFRCIWRCWDKCERTLINSTTNKKINRGRHLCTAIFVGTFTGVLHYASPHPNPSNPNHHHPPPP